MSSGKGGPLSGTVLHALAALGGVVLPVVVQVVTHAETWPVAAGLATSSILVWLGGAFHLTALAAAAPALGHDVTAALEHKTAPAASTSGGAA